VVRSVAVAVAVKLGVGVPVALALARARAVGSDKGDSGDSNSGGLYNDQLKESLKEMKVAARVTGTKTAMAT
jgi:hypothetical protein